MIMEDKRNNKSFEVLLLDEYAERLKVGRSTICNWKKDGSLKPGHHYFQKGKVLRFIWDIDLIMELHEISDIAAPSDTESLPEKSKQIHPQ